MDGGTMNRVILSAGLLCLLLASTNAFAQSRISGTVNDASGALIPGVSVTATNTQTGITTTVLSNESGAYNFASLQPGSYKIIAELPGFQTRTYDNVTLGTSDQLRLNFTLTVATVAQSVEVSVDAQALLTTTSSSIGEVLSERRVADLPMVRQDVLDLVRIMPGMRVDPFGDQFSAFTGLPTNTINTTRDGLSVTDTRNNVLSGTTVMNPDLIGEVRVILSPVDAEFGRGNGQVQMLTRSGTNQFRGAAVWNNRNTALSANSWLNNSNRDPLTGKPSPTPIDWRNTNQYTVSGGGPIVKNKTFFFALWDQNISRTRTTVTTPVLTDTARQGIFRYFDNYNSADAHLPPPGFPIINVSTATYPVVDLLGNPVPPPKNPDGSPYTGSLRCYSMFGNVKLDGSPFTHADCPGGIAMTSNAAWDSLRPTADQTGYIRKLLAAMPRANYFYQGGTALGLTTVDGLNVAAFQWTRSASGVSGTNGQNATTPESVGRKQINLKIDHNINMRHRLSAGWTLQRDSNDDNLPNWPGGFYGNSVRRPQVLTVSVASTFSDRLVNEVRYGISYQANEVNPAWLSSDPDVAKGAAEWLLQGGKNSSGGVYPVALSPGAGNFAFGNNMINNSSTFSGSSSPLYNYADTLSYSKGRHGFRMGVDLRFTRSTGYSGSGVGVNLVQLYSTASGGAGGNASTLANNLAGLPNQLANTRTNAANMLYLLSGSLNSAATLYWISSQADAKNGLWQDYTTVQKKIREQVENEWAVFFKDDWKVRPSLTFNLGVRYEIYGSPYLRGGYTAAVNGQGDGLFGASRTDAGSPFSNYLLAPGHIYLSGYGPNVSAADALQCSKTATPQNPLIPTPSCDPSKLTQLEYVGPGSDHPDKSVVRKDWHNIGPAIGFAWQLPWFGQGKTTLRAGFSMTYGVASRNAATAENVIGNVAGASSTATLVTSDFPALTTNRALQLADLTTVVPVKPTSPALPGGQIPIYNRATNITAYDPNFKTPYTENMTLSLTRSVTKDLVVDVRYEAALGRRRADGNGLNVNLANVYYNKELFDALEMTRRGEDAPLFDQMLAGLNLNPTVGGYGPVGMTVNSVLQRGSAHLRRSATFTGDIALGNYQNVANSLNTLNVATGLQNLPVGLTGVGGRVLRNGCDRIATGLYNPALPFSNSNILTRCFPEDYIVANPQLGNTVSYLGNFGKSNFHSLQTQITLRPTRVMSFQTTYIFANTLGLVPQNWTDPLNRNADYAPPYQAVRHDLRTNGVFELPIGHGQLLFSKSSGWVGRLLEHWQTGVIFNVSSGNPRTIIGAHMLYATGNQNLDSAQNRADIVSPLFDQAMKGHLVWDGPNNSSGLYYGDKFNFVPDPQCQITNHADSMGFNLFSNGSCTLQAVTMRQPDGSTPIVLQNPLPGHRGNMPFSLEAPGKWKFDANLSKRFRLTESKSLQFRLDALNVLNHPDLADPQPQTGQSINTGGILFGQIPTKGGSGSGALPRNFNLSLRLDF
jgi:Carboxypeptidase regulatory-like domain